MTEQLTLIATSTFGLESIVSRELNWLGYEDQKTEKEEYHLRVITKLFVKLICG